MNKKGNIMWIIIIFFIFFILLFLGFIMIVGGAVIDWTFDEATPLLSDLGVIESVNMTQAYDITIGPINTVVQNFTWIIGVLYVLMLIGSIAIASIVRATPSRWLIGFYFMLVIMLIIGSILMSNIYEEFASGTDDLSTRLNNQTLLSFMVLNSPMIFTVIAFITGIILFSGIQEEEFV